MLDHNVVVHTFRECLAPAHLIAYPGPTSPCEHEKYNSRAFLAGFSNTFCTNGTVRVLRSSSQMTRHMLVHL